MTIDPAATCMGSRARCTPINDQLDVGCIFCGGVFQPVSVVIDVDGEIRQIPYSGVKTGHRVLIGVIPDHSEA